MTRDELLGLGLSDEQAGRILSEFDNLSNRFAELTSRLEAAKQTEVENARLAAELAEAQAQLLLRDKQDAVFCALPAFHPKDARLILRLIDMENISIEGGRISGLGEQLQALKASAPYLFTDSPDPVGGAAAPGVHPDHFDMNTFLRGEN